MNIKDTLKYKINQASLLLLAFILPLHKALIVPMIIVFFVTSIVNSKRKIDFAKVSFFRHFSIAGLILFMFLGLIWTQNMEWAGKDIEIKFSLLAFPIIFYISNLNWSSVIPKVLKSFIEGTILSSIILLIMACYYFIGNGDSSQFYYVKLSIMHHPSYMAMYACFSICLIYTFSFNPKIATHIKPAWAFIYLVFLSFFTLLLASKTGLISILLIHFTALTYWMIQHKKIKAGIIAICTILVITIMGYLSSSMIQNRVNELFTFTQASQSNTSTNVRFTAWKTSQKLIFEAPILGAGTGDAKDALDQKYLEDGQFKLLEKSLNAHNQFLQTAVQLGTLGLLILLLTMVYPAILLWRHRYMPPLFLTFLLIINGMTEAWLETQSGVIFFAFFLTMFWSYYQEIRIQKLPLNP